MRRILEPELMNDRFQVEAYENADFSKSDKDLIFALEKHLEQKEINEDSVQLIIDIGCGPGKITELLSARWPNSKVIGIDGASSMIKRAIKRHSKYFGHLINLSYLCIDIADVYKSNSLKVHSADLIISNSFLHHLHQPNILWNVSKYLAAPGAIHFHRDLRRPESLDQANQILLKHNKNTSPILTRDYLASLLAAFTVEEVKLQLEVESLQSFKVVEIGDRYLQVIGSSTDPVAKKSAYLLNS